jgi:hypothetical protein
MRRSERAHHYLSASRLRLAGTTVETFEAMTKHDAKLHPGEYFIERRWKPDGQWELLYRDNDIDTMRSRFNYWKTECPIPVGQGLRFFAPDCTLIEEFIQTGEVKT